MLQGRRRGEEGGGGKEDIHVLLTEWRRKIKNKKMHARTKGQGMETNPLHALRPVVVSVARCNLHMLTNNTFQLPGCVCVTSKTKTEGNLGTEAAPKP